MRYLDLLMYSENGLTDQDALFSKHRANIGYLKYLAAGHEVYAIQPAAFRKEVMTDGVHFIIRRLSNSRWAVPFALFFRIRKLDPDVILVHSLSFSWQILFLSLIVRQETKILIQHHAERPGGLLRRYIQKRAASRASGFFFVSREQALPWQRCGIIKSGQRIYEVMEGSTDFMMTGSLAERHFPVFLWVGRLDRNKDPLTVLRAFTAVKMPGILRMIFSSDELLSEIKDHIQKNADGHEIELIGKVDHDHMEKYYQEADYFISASHYEGSGYALCEAMACGCIPIVTNIPSFRRMIGKEFNELFFPPGDVAALTRILRNLPYPPQITVKEKIRERFDASLSHRAIASEISSVLKELSADIVKG